MGGSFLSVNPLVKETPSHIQVLKLGFMDHVGRGWGNEYINLDGKKTTSLFLHASN